MVDAVVNCFSINKHLNVDTYKHNMPDKICNGDFVNLARNQLMHSQINKIYIDFLKSRFVQPNAYTYLKHFRQGLARFHCVEEDQIVMSAGSDLTISTILSRLTVNYKKILLFCPNYYSYKRYAQYNGLDVITIDYLYKQEDDILVEVYQKGKECQGGILILTNPDGFIGRQLSHSFIMSVCEWTMHHNFLFIIDQAYAAFADIDCSSLTLTYPNIIIINSFSKSLGTAGLRASTCLSSPKIVDILRKCGIEFALSSISLSYLNYLLTERLECMDSINNDIKNQREHFQKIIHELGKWSAFKSRSNFVTINMGSYNTALHFTDFMSANGFLIRHLAKLEKALETSVRITIADNIIMEKVIHLFQEFCTLYHQTNRSLS